MEPDSQPDPDIVVAPRQETMQTLHALFNYDVLKAEFDGMKSADRFADLKRGYKNTNTGDIVSQLVTHSEASTMFSVFMDYAPLNADDRPQWSGISASMAINQLMNSVDILPVFAQESRKLDILQRMMRIESCRSLLVIYDWHRHTGPEIISALMETHKASGYLGVEKAYPRFARLVHHIVQFIKSVRASQQEAQELKIKAQGAKKLRKLKPGDTENACRKRPRRISGTSRQNHTYASIHSDDLVNDRVDVSTPPQSQLTPPPPPSAPQPVPSHRTDDHFKIDDLSHVPSDMYGLRQSTKASTARLALVTPASRNGKGIGPNDTSLYDFAHKCLFDLWEKHLIYPGVKEVDAYYNQAKKHNAGKKKFTPEQVMMRTLGRGGVLDCIYTACGHEGIFAASAMAPLLYSPSAVFGDSKGDARFAQALLKDPVKTLRPVTSWLEKNVTDEIMQLLDDVGPFMHHSLLEMSRGEAISESVFLNPGLFADDADNIPLANLDVRPFGKVRKGKNLAKSSVAVTVNALIKPNGLSIAPLGMILREALNELRGFKPGNPHLFNVLRGRHATQGRQQYDRDQTDPVRHNNNGTRRLLQKIPGTELTKPRGLSCLFSWMSTGQGTDRTLSFMNQRTLFVFSDLEECITVFDDILTSNAGIIADSGFTGRRFDKLDGYVSLDNPNIYGSAANSLKLLPTRGRKASKKKYTLAEKFGPFFTDDLVQKWKSFLGDMLGQDPKQFTGIKHTWLEGLEFVVGCKLDGFKNGLTLLQTVNNMAFQSVLTMPTHDGITTWIGANPNLGAYRGLSELGFTLVHEGFMRVAIKIVYDHMDRYLTADDKQLLGFGYIFVEQVLCKVVRWDYRLKQGGAGSLEEIADSALAKAKDWVVGENATEGSKFPFPLTIDDDMISEAIQVLRIVKYLGAPLTDLIYLGCLLNVLLFELQ